MESDTEKQSKDYELFHHGILGMKWGVRRPVGPDGLIIKGGKGSGKSRKGSTSSGSSSSSKSPKRTITSTASKKKKTDSEINKSSGIEDSKANKSSGIEDSSSNSNPAQSQESQRASELLRRDPMTLSNTEIRELTQRLNLEAEYNRLTTPGPQKNVLDRGHDTVKKGLDYGRTALTIYQMYNHPATQAGLKMLQELIKKASNTNKPRLDPTPWQR